MPDKSGIICLENSSSMEKHFRSTRAFLSGARADPVFALNLVRDEADPRPGKN